MKTLTCRDLGGPCDVELEGASFSEIGRKSYEHVMEQINSGDTPHQDAAAKMRDAPPDEQKAMMAENEKRFDDAPNA